ncbi:MAG: hypothetical protein JSW40_03640, partial [Candidatus Omnitrophota bacterium]
LRVHPLWVHKCVDKYVVAHDEGKRDLVNFGIGEGKIISGFVSLREGFLQDFSEEHLREKNSLDTRPCLLFMSSSRGRFPHIRETIHRLKDHFNILIIYGRNKKLKRTLDGIDSVSIKLFPFYENIWELVSVSSAIITKPGGQTVFEGIYKKKPLVFTHYMPGQERANMDLVTKYGVAKFVKNQRQFMEAIAEFAYSRTLPLHYPIEFKDIRRVLREVIHETMTDNG